MSRAKPLMELIIDFELYMNLVECVLRGISGGLSVSLKKLMIAILTPTLPDHTQMARVWQGYDDVITNNYK